MRRQLTTVFAVMAFTMVFTGCGKDKETGTVPGNNSQTVQVTENSSTEIATVGMEEISGTLNISGTSVGGGNTSSSTGYGNTAGNLVNSGIVCEADRKIYYYNKSDNKKLYVMNSDGSGKEAFGNIQGAMELNVVGDYVYYQAGGIYRARIKDKSVETLVTDNCRNMVVTSDAIYYIKMDGDVSKVHKMNQDGSGEMVLSDNIAGNLNVNDGFIYYINGSDSGRIYRMGLDGSDNSVFCDMKNVQELLVDYSYVYLVSSSSDGNHVYRIEKSGGEAEKIIEDSCSNINMNGGYLYYYNLSDDTLCYCAGDGSNEKVLYSGDLNAINVTKEWVYFFNTEDFYYYRITKDGNNIEVVE
ncbi:MAG: DUF5050 domain-containing protein [Thermoflexaceae bacterium]|nr:DUF5050 domain-containing protein [Thermoflexaceae bacterium]